MKRNFYLVCFVLLTGLSVNSQNFHQLSYKSLSGDTVLLSSFTGKKTMFFIAPLNQSDSAYSKLQAFKSRYLDTVRIVCVLSVEDGYQSSIASSIQNLYSGMGVLLTEGMYTKKSSGSNQSSLMRWLTNKTHNLHFDMDAGGIGYKFFVTESGRLFAVMPSQTPLNSPIIDRIVHSSAQ